MVYLPSGQVNCYGEPANFTRLTDMSVMLEDVSDYRKREKLLCRRVMRTGELCARPLGHKYDCFDVEEVEKRRRVALEYGRVNRESKNRKRKEVGARDTLFLQEIKLSRGCVDCGYNFHPAALEFDHLPGAEKLGSVSSLVSCSRERLLAEIAKCEVVCANCHRVRTARRLEIMTGLSDVVVTGRRG